MNWTNWYTTSTIATYYLQPCGFAMRHYPDHLPDHPFWRFAAKIHNHAEAKIVLLNLQNHFGVNANLLLFCCWHAEAGKGRLSKTDILQLINVNANWHERVQIPLNQIAANCQNTTLPTQFKQELQDLRQLAEHIDQIMLTEIPVKFSRNARTPLQKLTDCGKNIAAYCKVLSITMDAVLQQALLQILPLVFPTIDSNQLEKIVQSVLMEENASLSYTQKKLPLD